MADNLTTPVPNGVVLATDDVGGVIYPRTKLSHGADGNAQDVSTNAPLPVTQPASQDPIFDHANGTKTTVGTTASNIIATPANCRYIRVVARKDIFIRTDGTAASDTGGSTLIFADQPTDIPVPPSTNISALGLSADTIVYVTPFKVR